VNVLSSSLLINVAELTDYYHPLNWKHSKTVSSHHIDPNIASFFGIMPRDISSVYDRSTIEYKNHIFVTNEFQDLVEGLLEVNQKGFGTFYRKKWSTVDNPYYGIQGGQLVSGRDLIFLATFERMGRSITS
jgi:hypothetical protein